MRQGEISVDGPSGAKNRRIAFTDRGAEDNTRIAICVHGLTRVGRDFDALAEALSDDYRVICPDVAGRGKSDWLLSPEDYSYAQYMTD
ncbi:MAG: alpha/beta hydrolase, partial [Rhodospirillaceae bacterium]|nr:alpha/beta hydrolase [Rhodospirillaceae bacterium]